MVVKKIAIRELVEFILRRGSIDEGKNSNHTPQELSISISIKRWFMPIFIVSKKN